MDVSTPRHAATGDAPSVGACRTHPTPLVPSLWADTLPEAERVHVDPLAGDIDADVAIVGGGLTGLWTAQQLLERDPTLRIVVLEREHIGFGASGRNGGWCSALLPMSLHAIAARHGAPAAHRMQVAMHDTVERVTSFAARSRHRRGVPPRRHRVARPQRTAGGAPPGGDRDVRPFRVRRRITCGSMPPKRPRCAAPRTSSVAPTRPTAPRPSRCV